MVEEYQEINIIDAPWLKNQPSELEKAINIIARAERGRQGIERVK